MLSFTLLETLWYKSDGRMVVESVTKSDTGERQERVEWN